MSEALSESVVLPREIGRSERSGAISGIGSHHTLEQQRFFHNREPARLALPQPVAAMVIDAEEDFDWTQPVLGTSYSTTCMHKLGDIQFIAGAWSIRPTYLVTYPILQDRDAVRALRRYREREDCEIGLQLHTWVTPPFGIQGGIPASFSLNLSPMIEERKLVELKAMFVACFGFEPLVYRSGRYGLSPATAKLLEDHGFQVDTSLAPRTDLSKEGGPDFRSFDYAPFWFGKGRRLLEIPLCRSVVGWGGSLARAAYQKLEGHRLPRRALRSLLTRTRAAERITLSPEGNDLAAMRRLVRRLVARGGQVLPISFHSSSLVAGRNPYVRSKTELHNFYDRLSATLAFLTEDIGCRFASLPQLPALMRPVTVP